VTFVPSRIRLHTCYILLFQRHRLCLTRAI
jgi:hypothetical protein